MRTWFLTLTICLIAIPAYAQYSGGTGEPDDPYQIATAEDLMLLGDSPGDYDKCFILTADIHLDPNLPGRKVFDRAVIAPDTESTPNERGDDPYDGTAFTGVFDGNGHMISHLTIEGGGYLGLFGWTDSGARICNLGLEAVDVSGVDVNGTRDHVGTLVGCNGGSITTCYSTGLVDGNHTAPAGGLVGDNWGTIALCYSTSTVGGGSVVGGLVGKNRGSITTSYSTGMVSGGDEVGGLVGLNDWGDITNSYSTGAVTGDRSVGGLVGFNEDAWIMSCYSTGAVTVTGDRWVGGLVGTAASRSFITTCFWDMETSGQATSAGGFGLTTTEMMDPEMLGLNGLLINDPNWVLDAGRDYPRLAWEGTDGQIIPEPVIDWLDGQGTDQEPYRIYTADQLILFGRASVLWDKHFILCADIDLDPNLPGRKIFDMGVIAPSGLNAFTGVFDGNNHKISHLTIEGGGFLGLFGQLGSGAAISNIALEAVDVNGKGDYVGGLVGYNDGSITSSYSTGAVSGRSAVGGLIGSIGDWYSEVGILANSYSHGTVNGDEHVGGLVGVNLGTITSSYSTGTVTGDYTVGGLVGINGGSIAVSVWDMEASGLTVSAGGVGLTTAEMMDPTMLGLNGFANDPNWILDAGRDYPRLAWEGTAGQIILEPIIDWLDGQGTDQEPYRIDTADQLILLSRAGALWDKHFILSSDIDLDPNLPGRQVFSQAVIQVFSGVFDGNNHAISHLTISGGSCLGLFGELQGAISDLGLEAVDVNGSGDRVAGLVGCNLGSITASYCTGTVTGNVGVGGLVGENHGNITASYSTGLVTGVREVGGMVGSNSGDISASFCTGSVTGDREVGGLVGSNSGDISASFCTGSVTGDFEVGGLVGNNIGGITSCYSTSSVTGNDGVGGLVGENDYSWNGNTWKGGIITNCYSTGAVSGHGDVGGLVGQNRRDGIITSSYCTGAVSGDHYVGGLAGRNQGSITISYSTGSVTGDGRVGGLVGRNELNSGSIFNCFWDVATSGLRNMCGGQSDQAMGCDDSFGKTTNEMQDINTYIDAGWDFVDETNNGTEDIWWIDEGKDYPRLWWELIPEN